VPEIDEAQRLRAQIRRETWQLSPLSDSPPEPPATIADRFEQLEQLRRVAFALAGIAYPEHPTPRSERQRWPMERIR
jgi:hypothetical protein